MDIKELQAQILNLANQAADQKKLDEGNQSLKFNSLIEEMVNLRAKLLETYEPVINLIEWIEMKVKEVEPEPGDYGTERALNVKKARTQNVNGAVVYKELLELYGHDQALRCFKIQVSNETVQELLADNPKLCTEGKPTLRFTYMKK